MATVSGYRRSIKAVAPFGDPWEPFGPEPDRPVGGLEELADALGA